MHTLIGICMAHNLEKVFHGTVIPQIRTLRVFNREVCFRSLSNLQRKSDTACAILFP